ncbi:DNA-binding transcriptional regulator, AcrR family [Thermomonospora echinospora]|uniref:DNA-binding transcriptional regulator, AcrR family n=1 Tax=Thermomonospora echinospora TaxID=1992 RepID=A0A1H6E7P4_9ACTN|nr:TetR/AcrR family transcriptional regulator [Thermomonospora echinospora]SEG93707.1 DNA-binding transcriptional regulator, AcrR family [Thermomonospora echinospora]
MAVARARKRAPKKETVKADGVDRRARLLEVAAELFATQGYAETTMRDIADKSGILAGSIYHHFSSKEAMLDEILRDFLTRLYEQFSAIEQEGDNPREALSKLVRVSFSWIHDSPHAVAVYQNETDNLVRQEAFSYVADYSLKIEEVWLRVLTRGQTSGVFRPDLDVKVSYLFVRDAIWSAVRWYRPGGQLKPETVAGQFLALLHGGLF